MEVNYGEIIYNMLNTWLKNCRSILAFRGNKTYKERGRDQKESSWAVFNSIFMNNRRPSNTLKGRAFFFITFAKKFIIQITWNLILFHWHTSPAINYGKLLVLFFLKIFPAPTTFSFFFFSFAPDYSLRETIIRLYTNFVISRVALFKLLKC